VGELDVGRKPLYGVKDTGALGLVDPDVVTSVGIERGPEISAIKPMWGPRDSFFRRFEGNHSGAQWAEGSAIEIKLSMILSPGRELGIELGSSEKVQNDFGLGDKAIPQMERELGVDTAEPSNKMVLECPDGAFCGISTVYIWWYQLEVHFFLCHEFL
jgi:hypothetical protein